MEVNGQIFLQINLDSLLKVYKSENAQDTLFLHQPYLSNSCLFSNTAENRGRRNFNFYKQF